MNCQRFKIKELKFKIKTEGRYFQQKDIKAVEVIGNVFSNLKELVGKCHG